MGDVMVCTTQRHLTTNALLNLIPIALSLFKYNWQSFHYALEENNEITTWSCQMYFHGPGQSQ